MSFPVVRLVLCVLLTLVVTEPVQVKGCKNSPPPTGCDCEPLRGKRKGGLLITCSRRDFTRIPQGIPTSTRDLRLSGNNIKTLSRVDFTFIANLQELNLAANALTRVDLAVFAGLAELETLSLQNNQIVEITNSARTINLSKLETINLSGNKFQSIDLVVFNGLEKLKTLMMRNNGIQSVTTSDRGLQLNSLESILLESNNLVHLNSSSFPNFSRRISVNFKANNISTIAGDAFGRVGKSSWISFENNRLKCGCLQEFRVWADTNKVRLHNAVCEDGIELDKRKTFPPCRGTDPGTVRTCVAPRDCECDTLTGKYKGRVLTTCSGQGLTSIPTGIPPNTRDLLLSGNNIKNLSSEDFMGVGMLEELNLTANALTLVDLAIFAGLDELKTLSLANNQIVSVINTAKRINLTKLETLNLSGNKFPSIDLSVLNGLEKLTSLVLSNSSIQSISTSDPRLQLPSLEFIFLDSNNLVRLASSTFPNFRQRISVNLNDNQITTIAGDAFGRVGKNSLISLGNNPLKCDCAGKAFRDWAESEKAVLREAACDTRETFPLCGEVFQCYRCEDESEEGECTTLRDCDSGEDRCLSVRESPGGRVKFMGCVTKDKCDDSNESEKLECCDKTRCNGGTTDPTDETFCEAASHSTKKGRFRWPMIKGGTSVTVPCPGDRRQLAKRECIMDEDDNEAKWGHPMEENCPDASDITEELAILLNTTITDENLGNLSSRLMSVSERCPEYSDMDVDHTVNILIRLMRHRAAKPEREATSRWASTMNNMFVAPTESIVTAQRKYKSAQRYLDTVDELGTRIDLQTPGETVKEVRTNLAVVAVSVDQTSFPAITIEALSELSQRDSVVLRGTQEVADGAFQKDAITLPGSILNRFQGSRAGGDRATFVIYQKDTFFKAIEEVNNQTTASPNSSVSLEVNSRIMAASIGNLTISNLREPVLITFRHQRQNAGQPQCVYWDFSNNSWSGEGCVVKETVTNSHTVCQCDHLTNFALLMDVYGAGPAQSSPATELLTVFSFVGCTISFFCLLLTILIYSLFSKLRKDIPSKILLNLCVALACINVTFVIGTYSLDNPDLCKAIAVLMHYFLLSSMAWMSVEAVYMYLALVLVFRTYVHRFMLKSMLFAWGIPLVIVAITLGVNETNNYGIQTNNKICWLTRTAFYAAALAPVCVVLIGNTIIFGLVIKQICGMSSKKLNKSETVTAAQQFRGIVGVFILLGLSWTFAIFAVGEASLVFQYLFTIFNSLQGLFIFIFYCAMKRDVQKQLFCCCPSAFDPSTSSHRSSKGTYSTSDRVKVRLRSAVHAVMASNAIRRGRKKRDSESPSSVNGVKIPMDQSSLTPTEKCVPPSYDTLNIGVLY